MKFTEVAWPALFLLLGSWVIPLGAQEAGKPMTRQQLLAILDVLKGEAADPVIPEIERQGVNFEMTAADEQELRAAGASDSLLAAIAKSYRQPGPAPVSPGPPLGKDELILLLENGAARDRLEALVAARGVSFVATPELEQQLTRAGAGERLILLVKEHAIPATNTMVTQPPPIAPVEARAPGSPSAPGSSTSAAQKPRSGKKNAPHLLIADQIASLYVPTKGRAKNACKGDSHGSILVLQRNDLQFGMPGQELGPNVYMDDQLIHVPPKHNSGLNKLLSRRGLMLLRGVRVYVINTKVTDAAVTFLLSTCGDAVFGVVVFKFPDGYLAANPDIAEIQRTINQVFTIEGESKAGESRSTSVR